MFYVRLSGTFDARAVSYFLRVRYKDLICLRLRSVLESEVCKSALPSPTDKVGRFRKSSALVTLSSRSRSVNLRRVRVGVIEDLYESDGPSDG